jgi:hypothetical protein
MRAKSWASRASARPLPYCSQQPRRPRPQRSPHSITTFHVADLGGDAILATQQLADDDDAAADAGGEHHDIAFAARGAAADLRLGRAVGVVLHHDRQLEPLGHRRAERLGAPGQVRHEKHSGAVRGDKSGRTPPAHTTGPRNAFVHVADSRTPSRVRHRPCGFG